MYQNPRTPIALALIAGACLAFTGPGLAQTAPEEPAVDAPAPSRSELAAMIDAALPAVIGENNIALVGTLLQVPLGTPLSRSFDPKRAVSHLFGRSGASQSPECRQVNTAVGDPDQENCTYSKGLEAGTGAFSALEHSKHMGLGTIRFIARPPVVEVSPASLIPVQISDTDAYVKAISLLTDTFGVPAAEIAPQTGDQVKNLIVAWKETEQRTPTAIPVQKMAYLRRGFAVTGIPGMAWVPGPGIAKVMIDDGTGMAGIKKASIDGWMELRPHPRALAENAKTRSALRDEIVDDLMRSSGPVAKVRAKIIITGEPTPTHGLLLPAVRIALSPVGADPSEAEQANRASTAGEVREYALVRLGEGIPD